MQKSMPYTGPFDGARPNSQPIEKLVRNKLATTLDVHSTFYTIQGEGPFSGSPAVFVRLAGCNLQCPMCDTEYTLGRVNVAPENVVDCVKVLPLKPGGLVVITGGEPFRQPAALANLIAALYDAGYRVQVETNGTLPPPDIVSLGLAFQTSTSTDGPFIVVSPKTGKVNKETAARACCYKYVLDHNNVNAEDGLPTVALNHTASPILARPPVGPGGVGFGVPVYVQPCDTQDEGENKLNAKAALEACLHFGYILQAQIHKHFGVE